jgi:argininosuccinate lyase
MRLALGALAGLYRTLRVDAEAMQAAADAPTQAATDLAELLVARGTPFRQAHAVVGGLVRESLQRHVPLAELVAAHPDLGAEGAALLEPGVPVSRRTTRGGAGPDPVADQMVRYEQQLAAEAERLGAGPGT